jgi:hypothetical protein
MKTIAEIEALTGPPPDAAVPLALLPVQVQARFVTRDGRPQLLVRIYPDEVHLDSHDEGLSAVEVEWGQHYWERVWPVPDGGDEHRQAWEQLAERFGVRRAGWVVRRTTPENLAARPDGVPSFPDPGPERRDADAGPVVARLLPNRWVVAGYVHGERMFLEAGAPVPAVLPVSLSARDDPGGHGSEEELPVDADTRWMVDFDAAEAVGMGIRIDLAPGGLDTALEVHTLLVLGVRGATAPEAATAQLEALLDGHRHTRGLAFVPPGTPTNNTAEASTGFTRRVPPGAAFDTEIAPPRPPKGSDADLATRALGVRPEVLAGLAGATGTDDLVARHLQAALWPVTGGTYLDQLLAEPEGQPPVLTEGQLDDARRFFVDFVRYRGPLPALQVGRQPYGLLPVLSMDLHPISTDGTGRFVRSLRALRAAWRQALPRVPRLRPGEDGGDGLVEMLRMQPVSVGVRARLAFDREVFIPVGTPFDLEPDLRAHHEELRRALADLDAEELLGDARVRRIVPGQDATRLADRLVEPGDDPGAPPFAPAYLAFLRTATFTDLLTERLPAATFPQGPPRVLLYLLLRHAVLLAYGTTARRILIRRGVLPDVPYREPVLVDVEGGGSPQRTITLPRLLDRDPTLRAAIHTTGAAQEPEAVVLDDLRRSLRHLEDVPGGTLGRHFAGCLDLFSYRLDAWVTGMATQRVHDLRRATRRGLLIGGYGWIEDLRPARRDPVETPPADEGDAPLSMATGPGGCLHAPSVAHAATAAVLRSGYLADVGDDGQQPFAVDLRSRQLRLAQWLLDGVREGQPMGALLGGRLERGLHEQGLDAFVAGCRRVSLLAGLYDDLDLIRTIEAEPPSVSKAKRLKVARTAMQRQLQTLRERHGWPAAAGVEQMEVLAGARATDGLALADRVAGSGAHLDRIAPGATPAPRRALEGLLDDLVRAVDAVADALTAEGIHQLVRGNTDRAAATVDAVAHGEIVPPPLQVAATPRPGTPLTHRLVVLLSGPVTAPEGDPTHRPRGLAEPALDRWLRQMLGDLGRVRYGAQFLDATGAVVLERTGLRLGELRTSHLDLLQLAAAAPSGGPSDLERLLEYRLRRGAPDRIPPDAPLRLVVDRAPNLAPDLLGLREFREVLRAFRDALASARQLDGRQLAPAADEVPPALDPDELRDRADAAATALRRTGERLAEAATTAAGGGVEALDDLRDRLEDLVYLGFPDAVPVVPRGADPDVGRRLIDQAQAVLQAVALRVSGVDALESDVDRAAADAEDQVAHDRRRLAKIFGTAFLALPRLQPVNRIELAAALRRSDEVQGGDPLQALSWLQAAGRVRAGAGCLLGALTYAAALQRPDALTLRVAQLPTAPDGRWVALPTVPGATLPAGVLSLVAHLPRPFRPEAPLSGLVVDEWVELVPAAETTTGVAFQYDAAGARPPQSVLLAVTPPGIREWRFETLEKTLLETLELARLRTLDPRALDDEVLFRRLLPAVSLGLNPVGEALSTDFTQAR